jgi:hypothetical protein
VTFRQFFCSHDYEFATESHFKDVPTKYLNGTFNERQRYVAACCKKCGHKKDFEFYLYRSIKGIDRWSEHSKGFSMKVDMLEAMKDPICRKMIMKQCNLKDYKENE